MITSVMVISSNDIIIEETTILLNKHDINNIIICDNKESAVESISAYMEVDLIILDQDLRDKQNSIIKEFNGENIAIKLMQDGIEVPTMILGTHTVEYEDDNTIYKLNIANENLSDAIDKCIEYINNGVEFDDGQQTIS